MRLWTLQPEVVLKTIQSNSPFVCDPALAECYNIDDDFKRAYAWMTDQMHMRKIRSENNAVLPIWGWYRNYGKEIKPDRRRSMFNNYDQRDVILELEIPDDKVLLSDFDDWHYVLNNFEYQTDEDYEVNPDREFSLDEKHESWNVIFDIAEKDFIQACFWEIKPEYLVKAHRVRRRNNK